MNAPRIDHTGSRTSLALAAILAASQPGCGQKNRPRQSAEPAFEVLPADLVARAVTLRKQALDESQAYEFLAGLTGEVGPRLAGSANDVRAVEWSRRKLEALGFENIRTEEVAVPHWERGEAAGEITSPSQQVIDLVALGGSVATPVGGIEAEVIEVAGLGELGGLDRARVAGKIVFVNKPTRRSRDGSGYGETAAVRRFGPGKAAALGAVALLIRSVATNKSRVPHTGATHYPEGLPRIPAAALSHPAADLLAQEIGLNEVVRFRLELGCRYLANTTSANVIAEIPGRERPEEIVLLAAHLDSWDIGRGAIDDGAGCAIVVEAARLIGQLDPPPRRTIRILLAANEELGVDGGIAYANRYAAETGKHVAAMEADLGAGRVWSMRSRVAEEALPAVRELAQLLAPLGIVYDGNEAFGGVDLLPLLRYRIPLFDMRHDATDYFDAYHSANDTLDRVDRAVLKQNVAAYAVVALVAAELAEGFGRAPELELELPPPFDKILRGESLLSSQ